MKRALFAAVVVCASAPGSVIAATTEVSATVDRAVVGVDETLTYTVSIASSSGTITVRSPLPGKIDGFDLVSQRHSSGLDGARAVIRVHFTLRARKVGAFTLGPGRVTLDDGDRLANVVKVQVVPAGKAPPPPAKPKPKPHGFFPDPFQDLFDDDPFFPSTPPPPPPPETPLDPLARIDTLPTDPKERYQFLRLVVDDPRPVVGAPVVAKLFAYSRSGPGVDVRKPPSSADVRVAQLDVKGERWKPITVEGREWHCGLAGAWTLYPLRAGKIAIDGPDAVLGGPHGEESFTAPPIEIEAVEPPLEGRPAGYAIGDVASGLVLNADVSPRDVIDGHALVEVKLRGVGKVDTLRPILATPTGVTWTSTNDGVRTFPRGLVIEGQRQMTFDARFDRTGPFDLGDVVLHVWDPAKKAYVTVRAPLGKVTVQKAADATPKSGDDLPQLPPPREAIGAIGTGTTIVDRPFTWAIAFGAPVLVLAVQGLFAARARRRARDAEREMSPAEQARAALEAARKGEEPLASLTRALDRALEARTGVRARGLTRNELARALEATDLPRPLRERAAAAFDDLEAARFAGGAAPSVGEIERICEELLR